MGNSPYGSTAAAGTKDPAVERLKRDLDNELSRFSVTYERQLEMVADLYEKLAWVEDAARRFMAPWRPAGEEPEEESRDRFVNEFTALRGFFIRRRIFIPKETASEVEELITEIQETVQEFIRMREDEARGIHNRPWRGWDELWDHLKTEIPSLREQLESRFRRLLGTS